MIDREARLRHALDAALERYAERVGEAFPHEVELRINPQDDFLAVVYPSEQSITIEVTMGVVGRLEEAWAATLARSNALPSGSQIELLGRCQGRWQIGPLGRCKSRPFLGSNVSVFRCAPGDLRLVTKQAGSRARCPERGNS